MSDLESASSLDDLVIGNVSEKARESGEKAAARSKAAAAKLKQIKKDESSTKNFDKILAKIIKNLDSEKDKEIPSLTILSILTLINELAKETCERAVMTKSKNDSALSIKNIPKKILSEINLWIDLVYLSDRKSFDVCLKSFQKEQGFMSYLSTNFALIFKKFLEKNNFEEKITTTEISKILNFYKTKLFASK